VREADVPITAEAPIEITVQSRVVPMLIPDAVSVRS
jgi:hypothetical protein